MGKRERSLLAVQKVVCVFTVYSMIIFSCLYLAVRTTTLKIMHAILIHVNLLLLCFEFCIVIFILSLKKLRRCVKIQIFIMDSECISIEIYICVSPSEQMTSEFPANLGKLLDSKAMQSPWPYLKSGDECQFSWIVLIDVIK